MHSSCKTPKFEPVIVNAEVLRADVGVWIAVTDTEAPRLFSKTPTTLGVNPSPAAVWTKALISPFGWNSTTPRRKAFLGQKSPRSLMVM